MIVELDPAGLKLVGRVVATKERQTAGTAQPSMAHRHHPAKQHDLMMRAYSAELAVSRYLNQEWLVNYSGPDGFDVAPNIEVRNTTPGRALYIKRREVIEGPYEKPASARYVLTWTGDDLTKIGLVGWITLADAMLEADIHKVDDKMYGLLFPADRLRPMGELRHALTT